MDKLLKIGILTFHRVPNYGALLQTYALKTYLENTYKSPIEIIGYETNGNGTEFETNKFSKKYISSSNIVKKFIKKVIFSYYIRKPYEKKLKKFASFREKHLRIDNDWKKTIEGYDYIFFGSDQIWNPAITDGFDKMYFGDFKHGDNTINIAYSASCGDVSVIKKFGEDEFLRLMRNFDFIGVREKSLYSYLRNNDVECINTVDPTLLLSKENYLRIATIDDANEDYMLVYKLINDATVDSFAKKIALRKGLKIIRLNGFVDAQKNSDVNIFDGGPEDFINLVANAKYILTNSFHGVVFSLLFNKNFNAVLPFVRSSRVVNLLENLGLLDRIITEDCINTDEIDFEIVNKKLELMKKDSEDFINSSIKG